VPSPHLKPPQPASLAYGAGPLECEQTRHGSVGQPAFLVGEVVDERDCRSRGGSSSIRTRARQSLPGELAERVAYRVAAGKEIELEPLSFDLVVFESGSTTGPGMGLRRSSVAEDGRRVFADPLP
jgi:hypothetical protein